MPEVSVPRFLARPEHTWVRCEEARSLPGGESACVVRGVEGTRIVIAPSRFFRVPERLVRAVKVGTTYGDDVEWLVDFPSGERLLVSEDLIQAQHGDPV